MDIRSVDGLVWRVVAAERRLHRGSGIVDGKPQLIGLPLRFRPYTISSRYLYALQHSIYTTKRNNLS
jgi:hypothetical protein